MQNLLLAVAGVARAERTALTQRRVARGEPRTSSNLPSRFPIRIHSKALPSLKAKEAIDATINHLKSYS